MARGGPGRGGALRTAVAAASMPPPRRPATLAARSASSVGLACAAGIERLEPPGRVEQQRHGVAGASQVESDLSVEPLEHGVVELVQRPVGGRRQQRQRLLGRPGQLLGARGLERTPRSRAGLERERGRALEERGGRRQSAARLRPPGRALQLARRRPRRVRARPARGARRDDRDRARHRWPRPAPDARLADPRPMPPRRSPNAAAGGGRRPARRARAGRRPRRAPSPRSGCPSSAADRHSSAGSPVGSAAARSSSRCVAAGSCCTRRRKLASIRLCSGSSRGRPKPPASSAGDSVARQLEQRERVAARLGEDPRPHALVQRRADDRREQLARVRVRQSLESQVRQPRQLVELERLAHREHEHDRLGLQAPGHEREHLRRRPIEPLGVVDQAQQRPFLGSLRQQAERREADQEAIGLGARAQPERGPERVALRRAATVRGGPAVPRTADGDPRTGAPSPTPPRPRGRRGSPRRARRRTSRSAVFPVPAAPRSTKTALCPPSHRRAGDRAWRTPRCGRVARPARSPGVRS